VRICHCADCGAAIHSPFTGDGPKRYARRFGTVRQSSALRPLAQYWCRSALDWLADLPSMRRLKCSSAQMTARPCD